jgi:hypothetical protein
MRMTSPKWFQGRLLALLIWLEALVPHPGSAEIVPVPDPQLRFALLSALGRPAGDITQEDLAGLVHLDASYQALHGSRPGGERIHDLTGLEGATNLVSVSFAGALAYTWNPAFNLTALGNMHGLRTLDLRSAALGYLSIPAGLTSLEILQVGDAILDGISLPDDLHELRMLDLSSTHLESLVLPSGLWHLETLTCRGDRSLTDPTLSPDMFSLQTLDISMIWGGNIVIPEGVTNLVRLNLGCDDLLKLSLPSHLGRLQELDLSQVSLSPRYPFNLPSGLKGLRRLDLSHVATFTTLILPADMESLETLILNETVATTLVIPPSLTNLVSILAEYNRLEEVTIPSGLGRLESISLRGSIDLIDLRLGFGLTRLTMLNLQETRTPQLRIPPGALALHKLTLPFTASESQGGLTEIWMPAGIEGLFPRIDDLRRAGVIVHLYPTVHSPAVTASGFTLQCFGDTGFYSVERSAGLQGWEEAGSIEITTPGFPAVAFTDPLSSPTTRAFYRLRMR